MSKFSFTGWDSPVYPTWFILNGTGIGLTLVMIYQGYFGIILDSDPTGISQFIMGFFIASLILSGLIAGRINRDYSRGIDLLGLLGSMSETSNHDSIRDSIKIRLSSRISVFRVIQNLMVTLGLIGTVIGIIIGFHNIPSNVIGDSDLANEVISNVLSGLSVAFYTTLVGSVCSIWVGLNGYLLGSYNRIIIARTLERL